MVSRHRFNWNGGWLFIYRWSITNCLHPFGELVSGLLMGTCFVLIAFFIQTNTITIESVLISIPIGILVGAINMSNNIRDIEEDIKGGRKTLVILRERESSGNTCYSLFIAYLWIAVIVLMGYISPWALVMFLGLRKPISAIRSFQKEQKILGICASL